MDLKSKILITGGTGMVGHALRKKLLEKGYKNINFVGSDDCDLRMPTKVNLLFDEIRPEYVFHLAARVYGIGGNAINHEDNFYANLMINSNVIHSSAESGVKKIIAMGSGCVYPDFDHPIREEEVFDGEPHGSEYFYAHSKRIMLVQLKACEKQFGMKYAFAISGNLYGEYDHFDQEYGHVVPSLISKFYNAKKEGTTVNVWGTGIAIRDFMYSEDAARALLLLAEKGEGPINIGGGFVHQVKEIVSFLQDITGLSVEWDRDKPDGQLKRTYDLKKLNSLGFQPIYSLRVGLYRVWNWYVDKMCGKGNQNEIC